MAQGSEKEEDRTLPHYTQKVALSSWSRVEADTQREKKKNFSLGMILALKEITKKESSQVHLTALELCYTHRFGSYIKRKHPPSIRAPSLIGLNFLCEA